MNIRLLLLYFFLGGTIISAVSYFGSQSKGLLASFVASLPSISLISLCIVYSQGGVSLATSYFKGLLIMLPAWILYVLSTMLIMPRLGLVPSIIIGLSVYAAAGTVIVRLVRWKAERICICLLRTMEPCRIPDGQSKSDLITQSGLLLLYTDAILGKIAKGLWFFNSQPYSTRSTDYGTFFCTKFTAAYRTKGSIPINQ